MNGVVKQKPKIIPKNHTYVWATLFPSSYILIHPRRPLELQVAGAQPEGLLRACQRLHEAESRWGEWPRLKHLNNLISWKCDETIQHGVCLMFFFFGFRSTSSCPTVSMWRCTTSRSVATCHSYHHTAILSQISSLLSNTLVHHESLVWFSSARAMTNRDTHKKTMIMLNLGRPS
jgi:hypothetical protein